jgi:hypothetical protein
MKNHGVSQFLFKLGLLSLPLLLLSLFYVFSDPFKVIWPYDSYYRSGYPSYVTLNRDFVSLETFLHHQTREKWDSFIFGNSRSIFYEVKDWAPHIGSDLTFHFDATGESLYGITRKLRFLDERHVPVRNALIILDTETLSTVTNSKGHLAIKHPLLSGQNRQAFNLEFFKTFYSGEFLVAYIDFKLSNKIKKYMTDSYLLDNRPMDYDVRHNEIRFGSYELLIRENPDDYYLPRAAHFYTRPVQQVVSDPVIKQPQKNLLLEMARILNSQHSNYSLIINPLYDQKQFNPVDLSYLKQIFGPDRVYDFSGINDITRDYRNYYEESHYRPHIARNILSVIYTRNN